MDAVWWFNVECFHDFTAAYNGVAGSCADAHRKSDSCVMNRHLITDETKLGLVWYVRKCPWMNRAASVPNGMRNDEAKQRASRIEKPCREWILYWMRGVLEMTCPRGRKVCWNGMMLTACPRWDMRRDDDCGFVWRDIPDRDLPPSCPTPSFHFQAPADFKKNAALSLLYCFFFFLFSRASHSWRRTIPEARRGMPETAICTWFVLVAGTYMKMRAYCRICMFTSEVMVLSKPEWDGFCRLDYRRSVNISIMKFEH